MKNTIFVFLFTVLLFASCSKNTEQTLPILEGQEEGIEIDQEVIQFSPEQESLMKLSQPEIRYLDKYEIPQEAIEQLQVLGFSGSDVHVIEKKEQLTGETSRSFLLEHDIEIPMEFLPLMAAEAAKPTDEVESRQFRTNAVVNSPRTIRVTGLYINSLNIRTGLRRAIDNYNLDVSIGLNFTLRFRSPSNPFQLANVLASSDKVVRQAPGAAGGVAGFPAFGRPFPSVTIYNSTASLGVNACKHVLTHEIGHCIGLRHTDWFNRRLSCSSGIINEGRGPVGAVRIPGTPGMTNVDRQSIMMACFGSGTNGEFSAFDIVALERMY